MKDGSILKFEELKKGLYMIRSPTDSNDTNISGYSFLSLVAGNKSNFTSIEIEKADKARNFHRSIGFPGYKTYYKLLRKGYFKDCPITEDEAKRAMHIYGID